jgi:hypothetical protein
VWQDPVIAATVLVFTLTVIPMIRANFTPPLMTSLPMVAGALTLTLAYVTLALWFSAVVELAAGALWAVLLLRGLQERKLSATL